MAKLSTSQAFRAGETIRAGAMVYLGNDGLLRRAKQIKLSFIERIAMVLFHRYPKKNSISQSVIGIAITASDDDKIVVVLLQGIVK